MRSKMLMTSIALCLSLSGNVHATAGPQTLIPFSLEAQPLPEALRAWAQQAKMQLIWPDTLALPARLTSKVSGRLSPEAALSKLLAGSGLAYEFVADGVVTLGPAANEAATTGTQRVEGNSDRAPSADVEEVVVTGTNIRGLAPAGSQLIVLDAEDIHHSGYSTTEQLLQSLPQTIRSGAYGESADARLSAAVGASSNITRGSSPNLRGLGATATLVLVNGHRIAASGLGYATDISLIPIDEILRVEVLLDGASAIYGADAIAGVVNIILKGELDGAETRAEYGVTSPSGREEVRISQSGGTHWDGGSILSIASSLQQTQLSSDERPFTQQVAQLESIFPRNRQLSALITGHQRLGELFTVRWDAQYGETSRYAQGATTTGPVEFPIDIDRLNAFMGLEFQGERWNVALKTSISRQGTDFSFIHLPRGSPATVENSEVQYLVQHQWTTGLMVNGRIARTPAGEIGLAWGSEHREERYSRRLISAIGDSQGADRTIDSAYAELHFPIFGDTNGIPGARRMSLSLAGRYDEYSDFGNIVNPKLGLSWMPMPGVEVRWTYSHSFRAPATGSELYAHTQGTSPVISIYSFTAADGSASPMALLTGSKPLKPERARHWTVGFSVRPEIEGLEIGATYYDISYHDRIIALPLDPRALSNPSLQSFISHYDSPAELDAALAREVAERRYVDRTGDNFGGGEFGARPENLVSQFFDARIVNAGLVHTSGLDITAHYTKQVMMGRWGLAVSANYIQRMQTALAPGIPATEVVGTPGNPAGLRAKTSTYFARGPWDTAFAVNFTDGYTDTTSMVHRPVDSYVTVDMHIRYTTPKTNARYLNGLSIALSVSNLLNEQPPYITGSRATRHANYDAVNADPLGRMISFQISKAW